MSQVVVSLDVIMNIDDNITDPEMESKSFIKEVLVNSMMHVGAPSGFQPPSVQSIHINSADQVPAIHRSEEK
jgi:hypothetical protein